MPQASEFIHDWNNIGGPVHRLVEIDDETLRDGLQSPSVTHPDVETKRQCLRYMASLGIQRVDVGLPMSSQVADIEKLLETIAEEHLPMLPGLAVRTVVGDLETVLRLRDKFPGLNIRANAFLRGSRIGIWAEGWDWAEVLDKARGAVAWATERGVPVMFVTEDTTRSMPQDVKEVYLAAVQAGAAEICVADTVGHALPEGTVALLGYVRKLLDDAGYGKVKINWHGHSDRGFGLANAIAAIDAGADVVHGTILGIGERTGNTPLDQLLVNLKLTGRWKAPLTDLSAYVKTISQSTATPVPAGYPVFGRDAFRTATGVHAAAVVKAAKLGAPDIADLVYSAVPAALVGRRQEVEIGPLSGRWCCVAWLEAHNLPVEEPVIARMLAAATKANRVLSESEVKAAVAA